MKRNSAIPRAHAVHSRRFVILISSFVRFIGTIKFHCFDVVQLMNGSTKAIDTFVD